MNQKDNDRPIGTVKRVIDEEEGLYEIEIDDPATMLYLLKLKVEGKLPAKLDDSDFGSDDT